MCSRAHSPGVVGEGARVPVPRSLSGVSCGSRYSPACVWLSVTWHSCAGVARTLSRLDVPPVHTLPALPRAHSLPVARGVLSRLPARAGTPVHSPVCLSHSPGVLPWRGALPSLRSHACVWLPVLSPVWWRAPGACSHSLPWRVIGGVALPVPRRSPVHSCAGARLQLFPVWRVLPWWACGSRCVRLQGAGDHVVTLSPACVLSPFHSPSWRVFPRGVCSLLPVCFRRSPFPVSCSLMLGRVWRAQGCKA